MEEEDGAGRGGVDIGVGGTAILVGAGDESVDFLGFFDSEVEEDLLAAVGRGEGAVEAV